MDQRATFDKAPGPSGSLLAVGDKLAGRFQIDSLVGVGGMGEVYRALDLELDEVVAVKVMLPGRLGDQSAAATLRREVRAARSIASPYVARTFELHNAGPLVFLVMEFINGASLHALMQHGKRPPFDHAVVLCRDVLLGLAAAHSAGVIHRDVKPGNVMVRQSGKAILTDFGIARLAQQQNATNGLAGTPAYMAPEQLQGGGVGPTADIFALAVVLFELVTDRLPWQGDNAMATAMARLTTPAPLLRQLKPTAPMALEAWLQRALERDPARRWNTAQSAADALAIAVGQHDQTGFFPGPSHFRMSPGSIDQLAGQETLNSFRVSAGLSRSGLVEPRAAVLARNTGGTNREQQASPDTDAPASSLPRLAVLPFRIPQQLPAALQAVVGLDDDLIGGLSGFRNLRVLSATSVAREADRHADWQDVARALGATHVVEGSLRSTGDGVRIHARLLRTDDEQVLWSHRVDVERAGLLDVGEELSKAIGQALDAAQTGPQRAKLTDIRGATLYLSARSNLASEDLARVNVAVALLEQARQLSSGDRVVQGTLAWALARQWSMSASGSQEGLAKAQALLRDLAADGELPAEAALASGVIELARGDALQAVRSLRHAIATSPSLAAAHELLGSVFVSADAGALGMSRLQTASMLAPDLVGVRLSRCQVLAQQRDWAGHDTRLSRLIADPASRVAMASVFEWRTRVALWRRDASLLAGVSDSLREQVGINADDPELQRIQTALDVAQRKAPIHALLTLGRDLCAGAQQGLLLLAAELQLYLGEMDGAFLHAAAAAGLGGVLLAWLRHCPLLEELGATGRWQALHDLCERRTNALVAAWHGDSTT